MHPKITQEPSVNKTLQYDVLIIGSGAAGLGLALSLARHARVALISKGTLSSGASPRAQGGIAAVISQLDSYESHIKDTMIAGAGLCDANAVDFTVRHAKSAINWLIDHGVQFTLNQGNNDFHLTQEGGHSHRRILHAADKTGAVVVKTLAEQAEQHPNIDCFCNLTALDLLVVEQTCDGALIFDQQQQTLFNITASVTVLATGGASNVYQHTSNPDLTSGDGIAMAWRRGCRVANLEFNQFHPTCLFHPAANSFLITEVMRGEGGILTLANGDRFMPRYDQRAELAPRDIVARAIHFEMQNNHCDYVYLDISHQPAAKIKQHFPTIYQECLKYEIDITQQAIPVVPAAHYTCGGVMTNLQGQTDIARLYAVGEVAYTGLHGANRMASNSLLECLVFAASASQSIQQQLATLPKRPTTNIAIPSTQLSDMDLSKKIQALRAVMWHNVGIVRSTKSLLSARDQLAQAHKELASITHANLINTHIIELNNLIQVAQLMTACALLRQESRGLHYNIDFPNTLDHARPSILMPNA